MRTYDLYAESGPMKKKTVVHVPSVMGCTAHGDSTDAALAATPDAIRAYLRFLIRAGERVDAEAVFAIRLADHDTSGGFLGSAFLPTDHQPLLKRDSNALMKRLGALHDELRRTAGGLPAKTLDARPPIGRAIRQIMLHVCGSEGGYLRGVTGASRLHREVEQGNLSPHDALDQLYALELERLNTMTEGERAEVIMRGQSPWSARSALRKMLEHAWEHYTEIAERLGTSP